MDTTIKCPHCGKKIEISQVLRHQVESGVRKELEDAIKKEIEKKSSEEITELKRRLIERDQKVEEFRKEEIKLREEKRKLEDAKREIELEVGRKIDAEKKRIEEQVLKQAVEEHRFKDLEKDKKISDLQRKLEEALVRAQLGSQQTQGEVLELDLEDTLKDSFHDDDIEPVGKGVKGADVRQIVKSPKGFVCGVILWETKRTKAWVDGWIDKLKVDLRSEKANIPVIVSSALPEEAKSGFGVKNGVWVVSFSLILPIASLLRKNLLDVGFQKAVSAHRGGKSDYLYEYVTSHEFRQQLEALVEVYKEMQEEIAKEKISFERIWKAREGQVQRLVASTANVVGSIQGRVGPSALPIKGLELPELDDGKK
jgi:hypothetical protein